VPKETKLILSEGYRCWAEINLSALERNLRSIRAALPSRVRYVAVVKADAYGHGLPQTATRLMRCGAELFAVANPAEAATLRELGSGWPILCLGPILPEEEELLPTLEVIPTVSSIEEAQRFDRLGKRSGRPLPFHLKIDTGMGRLGVWHAEASALIEDLDKFPHVRLEGVFTHFASADSDPEFTALQRQRFLEVIQHLQSHRARRQAPNPLLIHADNSAGLESFPQGGPFNGVRVGLRQFGVRPYPGSLLAGTAVEPVLSFHARVGLVKTLPAGTGISYGQTLCLQRPARTAVITAGYADGLPTSMSNSGRVLIAGQACPILGRVTMDQTIVDVTNLPACKAGDPVTLIGSMGAARISIEEFARSAGEIPWESLVSISKRVPRLYRTDTAL
jgi:alanine racemase